MSTYELKSNAEACDECEEDDERYWEDKVFQLRKTQK